MLDLPRLPGLADHGIRRWRHNIETTLTWTE
jgi:hypothetical protein